MTLLILIHLVDLRDHGLWSDWDFLVELFPTQIRFTSMSLLYTSAMAGSEACCHCWRLLWLPRPATFIMDHSMRTSRPEAHAIGDPLGHLCALLHPPLNRRLEVDACVQTR